MGLTPVPGLYRTRLVKNGPWVPVVVFWSVARDPETGTKMDRPAQLLCIAGGEHVDPWRHWPMRPIERDEYDQLVAAMGDDVRATNVRRVRTF